MSSARSVTVHPPPWTRARPPTGSPLRAPVRLNPARPPTVGQSSDPDPRNRSTGRDDMPTTTGSRVLRGLTATGVLLSAAVHLQLWAQGVRVVPFIDRKSVV